MEQNSVNRPSWERWDALPLYVRMHHGLRELPPKEYMWLTDIAKDGLVAGRFLPDEICHKQCAWLYGTWLNDRLVYAQLVRFKEDGTWYIHHDASGFPRIRLIITPYAYDGKEIRGNIPDEDLYLIQNDWDDIDFLSEATERVAKVFPTFQSTTGIANLQPKNLAERWKLMARMLQFLHEHPPAYDY